MDKNKPCDAGASFNDLLCHSLHKKCASNQHETRIYLLSLIQMKTISTCLLGFCFLITSTQKACATAREKEEP